VTRTGRLGRVGGLAASAVALTPFAYLWVQMVGNADDPLTFRVRLGMAIWMVVFGTPWMVAAWLLWRAWWRRAGAGLAALDGPARLLAAATAALPGDRRDWGAAMAAELAQVPGAAARWRFAAGCARTAAFPPRGSRVAVGVAGALAVAAVAAAALVTGAVVPAMRVFALAFVGLVGGLATLAAARSRRGGRGGPGLGIAGLALAGVAACVAFTTHYLAEYPSYHQGHPPAVAVSLPPGTAVVLAVVLAGCLWPAVRPPRWLLSDRHARSLGAVMAVALAAGLVVTSRLEDAGIMGALLLAPILVLLPGSAVAAAAGRSFRAGLAACAWAAVLGMPLIIVAWLAEALRWYWQGRGLLLDADGGPWMVGANLGDAVWWTLVLLALWAVPLGVIGAAAGTRWPRRRAATR
jgi:hypothetical protein